LKKWINFDKGTIFRDKTRGGLLVNFLKDYKQEFGGSIIAGCMKCLESYHYEFTKKYIMEQVEKTHDFELKQKYNGIQLGANGDPRRNGEMTEAQAIELLEKHPAGKDLFEVIPKSYYEVKVEVVKESRKPTKKRK
jgi:hypothetical protein